MSNEIVTNIFRAYSFLGVLAVKARQKQVKVSKLLAYFNALKPIVVLIFTLVIMNNPTSRRRLMKNDRALSMLYSNFSQILIITTSQINQLTTLLICLTNFWRQNQIRDFLNAVTELKLDEKCSLKFKKFCIRHFTLMTILFLLIAGTQFVTKVNFSLLSSVYFSILLYPYLFMTAFLSFLKMFEYFFTVCLKDFKHALKMYLNKPVLSSSCYHEMMKKHQKMFELCESFNKVFGLQVTLTTCCVSVMTIFQVIHIKNLFAVSNKKFHHWFSFSKAFKAFKSFYRLTSWSVRYQSPALDFSTFSLYWLAPVKNFQLSDEKSCICCHAWMLKMKT